MVAGDVSAEIGVAHLLVRLDLGRGALGQHFAAPPLRLQHAGNRNKLAGYSTISNW